MKKIPVRILIALFTFSFGSAVFFYWYGLFSPMPQIEVSTEINEKFIETSVCQLQDNPNSFDGKLVKFNALAYVINDGTLILYPQDCFMQSDNFMPPELEISSFKGTNSNLKLRLEGKNRDSREDFLEVEVEVIGKAKIIHKDGKYKSYSISPNNIKIISPFRKFEPKGAA